MGGVKEWKQSGVSGERIASLLTVFQMVSITTMMMSLLRNEKCHKIDQISIGMAWHGKMGYLSFCTK